MFFRRLGFAAFWIVLILFVVNNPAIAAHTTKGLFALLGHIAEGLARFATAF
ncbi:hypothetical protein [Actinomadura logoneensis]|uniref:hypothetical protein n=1 Tax=Actinomadura logoneensis TaxID=2293572 RepID=UPI0013143BE2|nr:hypothetical protein [Actinomadura logoneensis]